MIKQFFLVSLFIFFSIKVYTQCGQYLQNKIDDLSHVRFWDEQNGFVIGGASLLTTHDGGINWEAYDLPHFESIYYKPLNDVEIIDSNRAIIVGADGIVVYTEDKGENWHRKLGIDGLEYFSGVSFLKGTEIGYAVGVTGYRSNDIPFLYKTLNKGKTWNIQQSNINSLEFDFSPSNVYFINENNGYLWGGRSFYKTDDGGETWQNLNNPSDSFIQKLKFKDSNIAYLSGGNRIYKTTDNFQNWEETDFSINWTTGPFDLTDHFLYYSNPNQGLTKVNLSGQQESSYKFNLGGYVTDIYFVNDSVGYAVGKREQARPSSGRFILKTIDGGNDWEELDGGSPKKGNSNNARYFKKIANDSYLYSMISFDRYTGASFLLSNDNANSWKTIYKTDEGIKGFILYGESDYICHWRTSNPVDGGDGYIISESFDRGENWIDGPILNVTSLPPESNFMLENLNQVSKNDIFLTANRSLHHTSDKGITWNEIETPDNVLFRKYEFIDENNFMLYGVSSSDKTLVYITSDKGESWELISELSGLSGDIAYHKFGFINFNKIYSSPTRNKLLVYDSNSQNLTEKEVPFFINKIKPINDNSLIVLDSSNNLWISHDNGASWKFRFWSQEESNPNIYVENDESIFLWKDSFIQNLKEYSPSSPSMIMGNLEVSIDSEEEYIIPVDLFSTTEWFLESGGVIIANEEDEFYKVKILWQTEGQHILKAKYFNDCGESSFKEILVDVKDSLNSSDNDNGKGLILYPNPFKDYIIVKTKDSLKDKNLDIRMINASGQIILEKRVNNSNGIFKIQNISSSLSNGTYIIEISSDQEQIFKKIIKY